MEIVHAWTATTFCRYCAAPCSHTHTHTHTRSQTTQWIFEDKELCMGKWWIYGADAEPTLFSATNTHPQSISITMSKTFSFSPDFDFVCILLMMNLSVGSFLKFPRKSIQLQIDSHFVSVGECETNEIQDIFGCRLAEMLIFLKFQQQNVVWVLCELLRNSRHQLCAQSRASPGRQPEPAEGWRHWHDYSIYLHKCRGCSE